MKKSILKDTHEFNQSKNSLFQSLKSHAILLFSMVALLWAIAGLDYMLGGALQQFGIVPRTKSGLRGILFAPFCMAILPI